ncbi:hypothetical protein BGX33_007431 [Mortierella sp. NVP41]|nr:hypothetical protein BGX33_007431 [Mortierella sp. NVP41]
MLQSEDPSTAGTTTTATATTTTTAPALVDNATLFLSPPSSPPPPPPRILSVSSANRVFQIPELADNIAVYLRPIYISQLRLVSRALYVAYRPHLRLHLHRDSTASWTSFPTLQEVTDTKTSTVKETFVEGEDNVKWVASESDTAVATAVTMVAETEYTTPETTTAKVAVQSSGLSPQDEAPKATAGCGYGYEDGLTYGNLVETLTTDSLDNLERLIPVMRQCPNIHTLSITRWNKELDVFEDLLHISPQLKTLSVAFYTTVDLTEFLRTLTGTSASSSKADGTAMALERKRGAGCRTLQSLDIKHRVPDINPVEWKALKAALDALPSLRHLSLTGVEFIGVVEPVEGVAGAGNLQGLTALLNGQSTLTTQFGYTPWHTTATSTLSTPTISSSPTQPSQGVFPKLQSLSLSFCDCPASTMRELNRVFPKLTSLELNRCRSNWFQVFEPDPSMPASPHLGQATASVTSFVSPATNAMSVSIATGTSSSHVSHSTSSSSQSQTQHPTSVKPRVPFPELRHLKLTARQGYEILLFNLDLVAHRPHLTSVEIYDMSLKIETLSSLVSICKSEGRFLKRWAHAVSGAYMSLDEIQTYLSWDEIQTNEVPSLSRVEHLYVQKPGIVSVAATLTSLHIGDEGNFRGTFAMRPSAITMWNEILQKLPRLRILKIDQLLKDYCLFQYLGRDNSSSVEYNTTSEEEKRQEKQEGEVAEEEEGGREKENGSSETSEGAPSLSSSIAAEGAVGAEHVDRIIPKATPVTSTVVPATMTSTEAPPTHHGSSPTTKTTALKKKSTLETPLLEELHVAFEWDLDISTTDLDRELIQRFRLLERLYLSSTRKPDGFAAFTQQTRPGLAIVHRRDENL